MFQVCGRVFAGHSLGALQLYTVRQRVMTHMRCLCNEAPYASYSYALRIGRGMLWEEVLRHRDNRLLLGMDVTSTPPAAGAVGGKAKGVTFGPTTVATPAPSGGTSPSTPTQEMAALQAKHDSLKDSLEKAKATSAEHLKVIQRRNDEIKTLKADHAWSRFGREASKGRGDASYRRRDDDRDRSRDRRR